jgi:carboxylate-amine ligase
MTAAAESGLPEFRASRPFTLGVELELMLLDRESGLLASASPALLGRLEGRAPADRVKSEITQSMIEVASGVHVSPASLEQELRELCGIAQDAASALGLALSGGGAHPFRDWPQREIYPDERFDRMYETYGYLAKLFTVFGQHIHVGVASADDAVYLTHAFNACVPQLIALAASSPFQRGVDTGFHSSRAQVVSMFPLSGHLPEVARWDDFRAYFERMQRTGLVRTMKDFYWDVRPKPEFGTVEIRVCDTPLTIAGAADLAALCQAVARARIAERPAIATGRMYETYSSNRFLAARSAGDATVVEADGRRVALAESIEALVGQCLAHGAPGDAAERLGRLRARAHARGTDAAWIRNAHAGHQDWGRLMAAQAGRLQDRAG